MIDPKTVRNREARFVSVDEKYRGKVMPVAVMWYRLIRRAEYLRCKTGMEMRNVYTAIHLGDYVVARRELRRQVSMHNEDHPDWPLLDRVEW